MTILRQLLINKHLDNIGVGYDINNKIKSYCFYDIITWETINFIRQSKFRINNLIKHSCISRNMPYDFYELGLEDNGEQWIFWIYEPNENGVIFQSVNCKLCGEYKFTTHNEFPNKIRCFCLNDEENIPPLVDIETGIWLI